MTTHALTLPALPALAAGSLGEYIRTVQDMPMLSAEQERDCALRFRQHQDLEAARTLVLSHLRLVVKVARGYAGYGLPMADLIQEGNVGLMQAVKRFDPARGARLVTFATYWIRAEIHQFVLRNWRMVKIATTRAQRKLFFKLRSARRSLGKLGLKEAQEIAEELGVKQEEVLEMNQRLSARDLSLDPAPADGEAPRTALPLTPVSRTPSPEEQVQREQSGKLRELLLKQGVQGLDPRSRDIIQSRWLSETKSTLHELAARYQVSAERIRQIEKIAMGSLRTPLEAAGETPS